MVTLSGGDKLEGALRDLASKIAVKAEARVGFLETGFYDGEKALPVAQVAYWQEFGTKSIPPRPFFRTMIAAKSGEWGNGLAKALEANDFNAIKALDIAAQNIDRQLKRSIIDTNAPPLSPITVMLRAMRSEDQSLVVTGKTVGEAARRVAEGQSANGASTKPLVDTGHMLASVNYEIVQ